MEASDGFHESCNPTIKLHVMECAIWEAVCLQYKRPKRRRKLYLKLTEEDEPTLAGVLGELRAKGVG